MSIVVWLILGLVAGFIASKTMGGGSSLALEALLGIVGAFAGGFIFSLFGAEGVTGLNLYSILVAVVGAWAVLFVYHTLVGRRAV